MKVAGSKSGYSQFTSSRGFWRTGSIHLSFYNNQLQLEVNSTNNSWATGYSPSYGVPFILVVNFTSINGCVGTYRINGIDNSGSYIYSTGLVNMIAFFDIGGWSDDSSRTFNGSIGEFTYYNKTLSLSEIQQV
jgi:hypothetical protein